MRLVYVVRVEGINRSDLDSRADVSVVYKEALVLNDFNCEATVSGCDSAGETR
jgi:hypothetical protein